MSLPLFTCTMRGCTAGVPHVVQVDGRGTTVFCNMYILTQTL